MRLRSTLSGRSYAHAAGGPDIRARGEAGASSADWYADLQGGGPDVNPELAGSMKFPVFDEMAMTDPTIKSLLQFWALPVRSALWTLLPRVKDDPLALRIRDFCAWNLGLEGELGQMDLSWGGSLGMTCSTGLKHGPSIEELVWDEPRDWRDANGDLELKLPLARLAPRPAHTIGSVKRERGRVVWIDQTIPGTTRMLSENLSYIVFDPDDTGRWEGSSMIRPAWAAWRMKKALQIAAGIGWDRFSSGLPVVWHPDDPESERRAREIGEAIRNHERAYVNFPATGPSAATGRPASDWYLDLVNGANTLADPVPLLRYFTEQESEAGLAHFSRLGTTESGSRAVGEVQIDPFFLAVQALAELVRRERERQVLRRIVEINFGHEKADLYTPKLMVSRIQAKSVEVMARAISYLSPAGFVLTHDDSNELRELLGFARVDDAAESAGIDPGSLRAVLAEQGLTAQAIAAVVNALPAGMGVARNRVAPEGSGLRLEAEERLARRRERETIRLSDTI